MKIKLALAMIVRPTDEEAELLSRCLRYVAPNVDGIFITLAGNKKELKNNSVRDVAKLYGAEVSEFEWVQDFSKARNFNFSQVPKDYTHILWLDADDVLRGANKLRDIIKDNQTVDVLSLWYLYSFDENKNPVVVHHKSRVIKNDGCVEWAGRLHEDFRDNRQIIIKHVEGIDVLHLSEDDRRADNSKRNVEIAKEQSEVLPDDPRTWWNLGNSLKGIGDNEGAIEIFTKFLEMSKSDEEKYIVRLRLSECNWILGKQEEAIEMARYAIGLKPDYPDAYHLIGGFMHNKEKYDEAIKHYFMGLTKKPPRFSIIVYNPRDYDYVPMMNLAKSYFQISRPDMALPLLDACLKITPNDETLKGTIKDMKRDKARFDKVIKLVVKLDKIDDDKKLRKQIDKIDIELRSHPAVCNLINQRLVKKESSGKDMVIMCGFTEKEWTPRTANEKGVGGSEEAVIHLAKRFVKRGWNVTVYNNCGHQELDFDGVKYKPFWSWNYRDKQDVTILWRSARLLAYEINSDKVFLDLHDVIQPGELNEQRLDNVNKIFVKSKFHRNCFPDVADDKFVIIPNGIESETFKGQHEKDQYLMINTSSADRSLAALVELFPKIKEQVPEAKLLWAYGWGIFDIVHSDDAESMAWKKNLVEKIEKLDGFESLGMISHGDVAELYRRASVLAYPSEFAEIDCISVSKAMAAGAFPITTDFSAVGEKAGHGGVFIKSDKTHSNWCKDGQMDFSMEKNKDRWVREVVKALKNPTKDWEKMSKWALERFDWETIVDQWEKIIDNK